MTNPEPYTFVGAAPIQNSTRPVTGEYVQMLGEKYYRIGNYDQMPPFFMSLVSSDDHWLFIASTGGLTAGRVNAESALFPYETVDKIIDHSELTGSKTIIHAKRNGHSYLWEPFSERYAGIYHLERHLYKNFYGNKLIFEEVNHNLQLTLRTAWRTNDRYGFVKSSWLQNDGAQACAINLLDGLQNLLPYGVTTALQDTSSNLLHAYKRNELEPETGLGIFTLNATLTDRAEPSESLQATTAWQVGLDVDCTLLSNQQMDAFRYGYFDGTQHKRSLTQEEETRGKPGAYLVTSHFALSPGATKRWHIVADVNQTSSAVTKLVNFLQEDNAAIEQQIEADIEKGTAALVRFVAEADGLQVSVHENTAGHHYANVLFNIMRGGIFANGYQIDRADLIDFVRIRNRNVLVGHRPWFEALPAQLSIDELYTHAAESGSVDLKRLCYEYLPLTFSRRHGDPSRPWNQFSINLKKADGSPRLDYQGNWRDIFQNWEPLLLSFPAYTVGVIAKFLNATTADGYNPYRVTRDGIEWEEPEPDNPWSNIGYWSDHQIIYLQKLLEIAEAVQPGTLAQLWNLPVFAYANVPYRLRSYTQMLDDWYETIDFDEEVQAAAETAVAQMGTDGRLLRDSDGDVIHVTMIEKLLALLLAKLTNLVPEGGIWMNTQRPEWNDANNALVGNGLSVVTVAYLRRFIAFWEAHLDADAEEKFVVNTAVADLFTQVHNIFSTYNAQVVSGFNDQERREIMDALGSAATAYRTTIYAGGLATSQSDIGTQTLRDFLALAQSYIEQTLRSNWRPDRLAHTYNILRLDDGSAAVENLYLMLEGQVALLSSGSLSADEALSLLNKLRHSDLYRADQHSYMLYPNREQPRFREKNNVSAAQVADSALVDALVQANDVRLLVRDEDGVFHFNGRFRNADDVVRVLDELEQEPDFANLVKYERKFVLNLFEETFDHNAFTGRSGTFFAYEGLGSIYWHMVSKLLLAAQECYQQALEEGVDRSLVTALSDAYYDIRLGMGFNKSPAAYGAFPTDPYSHTPLGSGARQPGMTGLVKEEILTRWGELGVSLREGILCFTPTLLRADEFFQGESSFDYIDNEDAAKTVSLPPNALAFTFCQVPVVYQRGENQHIEVVYADGRSEQFADNCLDKATSDHIISRDGNVQRVNVTVTI